MTRMVSYRVKSKGGSPEERPDRPPQICCIVFCIISTDTINKREKKEIQHRYGSYENVLLSDAEYGKLRQEFPGDYQMRVERLSEYMASTGRSYKNHLATIRSWAKREKPKYNPADYTFEEGDSL